MSNIEYDEGATLIGRTHRNDDKPTLLVIPAEIAKKFQIESSKVSMSVLYDFDGNRYSVVSKYRYEIVIE